jgi:hypothetical protein
MESPSTELLSLGKGIVSVAEWAEGAPGTYRDVGEAPAFDVNIAIENLPYKSSRGGSKRTVKETVMERGYTVNFDLSEIGLKNLEMFLMGTKSGNTIHALTDAGVTREYALKFKSDNPEGPQGTWEFWKCKIKPNGATSLISDEWMKLPHVAQGLADTALHPDSPYFDARYTTTTTTSTTTTTTS